MNAMTGKGVHFISTLKKFKMTRQPVILVCLIVMATALITLVHCATLTSDQQLYAVLNLSIQTLKNNGKLSTILAKYQADDLGLTCNQTANQPTTWPAQSELGTAMKQIVSTGSIRFCRSETLTRTYFNLTSGLEFEIGKEIASMISSQYGKTVEVSWQRLATKTAGFFPTVLDALELNTCDAGLGILSVTPAREQQANFTCAYVNNYSAYLQGPRNLTMDLSAISSLNQSGLIIAALPGTAYGNLAATFTNATYMTVADTASGLKAVISGAASVFIGDYAFFNGIDCVGCKAYKYGIPDRAAILTRQIPAFPASSAEKTGALSWMIVLLLAVFLLVQ